MANQLYAKIKRSSKYASQNEWAKSGHWGLPFKVEIVAGGGAGGYIVQGGPGGQYRLADVNLYVVEDGVEVKIS